MYLQDFHQKSRFCHPQKPSKKWEVFGVFKHHSPFVFECTPKCLDRAGSQPDIFDADHRSFGLVKRMARRNMCWRYESMAIFTPPKTNKHHLKNAGWKMIFPFEMVQPFRWHVSFFFGGNFSDSKRVEQQLSKMFETTNLSGAKSYRRDDKRHLQRMEVLLHRSVVVRSELKYSPCKWLEDVRSFSRHFFSGAFWSVVGKQYILHKMIRVSFEPAFGWFNFYQGLVLQAWDERLWWCLLREFWRASLMDHEKEGPLFFVLNFGG